MHRALKWDPDGVSGLRHKIRDLCALLLTVKEAIRSVPLGKKEFPHFPLYLNINSGQHGSKNMGFYVTEILFAACIF